jgi:hypothetical protein
MSAHSKPVPSRAHSVSALAVRVLATGLWTALIAVVPLGLPIAEAYWATAFLSCLIFYVANKPRLLDLLAIAVATGALGSLHFWMSHGGLTHPFLGFFFAELGLATFLVVGVRICWCDELERRRLISDVITPSTAVLVLLFAANNLLNVMGLLHASTYDVYAYSFDGSLGFQPSFLLGRWIQTYRWFGWPTIVMYYSILLPLTLAYVVYARKFPERRFFMLELFFVASFLGYLFYSFFPAAGPLYAFGPSFPWSPLPFALGQRLLPEPIPLDPRIMRNAVPSLHMTWALLIWWNMKPISRTLYWTAFIYAVFTVFGTLGTGEHYLVDLVVAFPFALMVQGICSGSLPLRSPVRLGSIVGGLVLTLTWIALLRFGTRTFWISPVIPWLMIVASISGTLVCSRRLIADSEEALCKARTTTEVGSRTEIAALNTT